MGRVLLVPPTRARSIADRYRNGTTPIFCEDDSMPDLFDLHTHTVHSDGTTTPEDNVSLAKEIGLTGLALTDHDTVSGWTEMRDACELSGLVFIPGIELSTERDGRSVHLLGYWIDPDDAALADECDRLRNERSRRADDICERLEVLGVGVDIDRVRELAGEAPIGRPHIATAMIQAGHVADIQTAFDDFLADGGPAYVPKYAVDPAKGVELLVAAGGAAVLAHPGFSETGGGPVDRELLDELVGAGLSGVEVDHPAHTDEMVERWGRHARAHELLVTGASDFHGERKQQRIGERTTTTDTLEQLQALASSEMHDMISATSTT